MPASRPTEVAPEAVRGALDAGALLLTSTPGLAADWRRRLVTASEGVVATPAIESWGSWLTGLALTESDLPVPYTKLQELQLWERIIAEDMGKGVAGPGLARHAAEAYRLMREYGIDAAELAGGGEEAEALARWMARMQTSLAREGRMLAADLPASLLPHVGARVSVPHILLDGFETFTPMQQSLLDALQAHGARLSRLAAGDEVAEISLTVCAEPEAEYRHVAAGIATCMAADAQARIAVVTSRQVSDIEALHRILDELLLPAPEARLSRQAVNMPGQPLADQPLIRQSLALLGLAGRKGALLHELAPLFFSPGIRGFAAERMARARLEARLREDNRYYLGFASLLKQPEMQDMPALAGIVRVLSDWDDSARPAGRWEEAVRTLLQDMGVLQANAAGRSGGEIRQLNALREALASLVAVDAVRERLEWGAFQSLLASVCRQTPFALPVQHAQVSVLPLEQIAGLRFDAVFALGLDEDALPLPAGPSALLPFAVQGRHALPCATPALAFARSSFLWQQLQQAAPVLHVSFALSRGERVLHASPLLAGPEPRYADMAARPQASAAVEPYADAPPVPLAAGESVAGGSDIIKQQSACPFRAFAVHRLALAPLGEARPGLEPKEKGSLLHHALQHIWETLGAQQALLALDEAGVDALIRAAIDHAWMQLRMPVAEATRAYERQRMDAVLHEWLAAERQRPPFRVEHCEKAYSLLLPSEGTARFTVRLKADRIDRDDAGHRILIDYKSGQKQSAAKWIGARMEQPQLPLYSVAEHLGADDAVCFARVRSGECGFEGLSGEDTGVKGIEACDGKRGRPDDWPALQQAWRRDIDALAGEFVAGRAEVVPRNPKACAHCGLEAVCRIDEIGFAEDIDDDDAGDGA